MANLRIYKYILPLDDIVDVEIPEGAEVIHVADQRGQVCLWAIVNLDAPLETRRLYIVGTGNPMPQVKPPLTLKYLGTAHVDPFVWHVFETEVNSNG